MRLSSFFKYPSSWSQGAAARTKEGPINLHAIPYDGDNGGFKIESLSLAGAVSYFYSQERNMESRVQILNRLSKAIQAHTGKKYFVEEYNNLSTTKFDDIRKVLKIADL